MSDVEIFEFGDEQPIRASATVRGAGWIGRLKRVVGERVIILLLGSGIAETARGDLCVADETYIVEACRQRGAT